MLADLHGAQSACVRVTSPGPLSWSIRFEQSGRKIQSGEGYTLDFWAKAEHSGTLRVSLEQSHEPWHVLASPGAPDVTTDWQRFRLSSRANESDNATRLIFDPPSQPGRLWLAGVSLRPGGITGLPAHEDMDAATPTACWLRRRATARTRTWAGRMRRKTRWAAIGVRPRHWWRASRRG